MPVKDKNNIGFVQCINCRKADLMQWFNNPVVAHCNETDERQVAEANRICKEYQQSLEKKEIRHFNSYD